MKVWKRPRTEVQKFEANEYVAACGSGTIKFTCDAGGGKSGTVYIEDNGVEGLQTHGEWIGGLFDGYWQKGDTSLGGYHACGTTHEADSTDEFLQGYYVTTSWWGTTTTTDVIVWRGPNGDNVHCTTNLNMDEWETTRS